MNFQDYNASHRSGVALSLSEGIGGVTGTIEVSLGTTALLANLSNRFCLRSRYSSSLQGLSDRDITFCMKTTYLSSPSEFAEANSFSR